MPNEGPDLLYKVQHAIAVWQPVERTEEQHALWLLRGQARREIVEVHGCVYRVDVLPAVVAPKGLLVLLADRDNAVEFPAAARLELYHSSPLKSHVRRTQSTLAGCGVAR